MDSRTGLDYIVENRDYVAKLGAALDTANHTVKKQVFELLAALCAYSAEGYNRALETLEHYMNLKSERYRLKLVVTELDTAPATDYQIALLAFVNCLIISAPTLPKRIKIRNELIGLNLLPVINNLRKSAQHGDIKVQLDVFDEQRESDEAQSLQDPDGINLNSHLDVFYAILRQVADTPQGIPFLSILQHLLRIDPKEAISDLIWDTAETLVHRATLLENREDSVRLLRAPSVQKFTCPHCRGDISAAAGGGRKQSLAGGGGPLTPSTPGPLSPLPVPPSSQFVPPAPPPPPPPAPLGALGPAIPPPPPPMMPLNNNIPPPPPPQLAANSANAKKLLAAPQNSQMRPKTPDPPTVEVDDLLPQQETPVPKSKMKTINWNKIPSNKVMGHNNIWTMVATSQNSDKIKSSLDWEEIEGLFCQQQTTSVQGSPKLGRDRTADGTGTLERKKKDNEINLLDGKRSLNVNIFLKQFRSSNEDIIQLIKNGEHDDIGAEKLRGLLKILPEVDELDMLKSFDGDKSRLGNAEKFLLDLMKLSNYKLRIECMLLREEFAVNMGYLEPAIRAMLYAGDDLMTNKALQEVLYMVLVTGNFLNSGGYAGQAAGVKLSSLQKLTDIRANKPGMNLIHFVALQAEKTNPDLLKFPDQLTTLENASKTSVDQLNNELTTLDGRIRKIKKQIESPQTDGDIKEQMMEFLQISEREVAILQNYMNELTNLRVKLAEFFVEDVNTFKMEECYKIFQNFRERFKQALVENERRRYQEEQASIRRKQREDQLAAKRRTMNLQLESNSSMDSNYILDPLQFPVSPALSRRRMGSFNTHSELGSPRDMGPSPEGSLRRRKSRNLNEDETLMDFLRQSGHDNASRERKSYGGSLDRSWARRNRDAGFRKRPDLFNVDFNADRERGHSPSPQVEVKELPGGGGGGAAVEDPSKQPRISKEWHQKIQSWLQHNDDGKRPIDYKKTRVSNRRSYDEDSESDRSKLDPLPEEPTKKSPSKWQPSNTLEGTDIVGAIEAIQEAQPKVSGWTEGNRIRRQLSKEKCSSPQLESIKEENKRKLVIQELGRSGADENIDIYFRRPVDIQKDKSDHRISTSADNTQNIYVTATDSGPHSITSSFRRGSPRRDKIEIDSDNIETPPVTRKSLAATVADNVDSKVADNDGEPLGNGQFDRHSSARKTRRYKRPTLGSGGSDDQAAVTPEPSEKEKGTTKVYLEPKSPPVVLEPATFAANEDKDSRLKRWQERLKSLDQHDNTLLDSPTPTNTTSRSSSRKNISASLNPEEVKDAVHYLQRQAGKSNKIINMELNDEGFEESQSLVSDTPSQGKDNNSGAETAAEGRSTDKVKRMNSSESAITSTSTESKTKPTPAARYATPSSSLARRTQSLRNGSSTAGGSTPSRPNLPVRSNSALRKNDSGSSISSQSKRNAVQKSNSRNSLLSSRSSLNSAVSTNTVKRAPLPTGSTGKSTLLEGNKKSTPSSLTNRLSSASTKIPGSTTTKNSSPPTTTTATLSAMRSGGNNVTSASAAAQQLRDQLKRPTGIAPSLSTPNATAHTASSGALFGTKDSVNNRLNLTGNNYPLKGSSSSGGGLANSSTNSINSYLSIPKTATTNSTNSTMSSNNQQTTRTGSTGLTRKGSGGSNFMRPTASSVTKTSAIGAPTVTAKPSRFR